jgi:CheY-like chemotaxis protein
MGLADPNVHFMGTFNLAQKFIYTPQNLFQHNVSNLDAGRYPSGYLPCLPIQTVTDSNNHKHIVLYVDDDPDDRDLLREVIGEIDQKYLVRAAPSGKAALDYLRRSSDKPCLIILDMNMPQMDGKQILEELRNLDGFSSVPVVIYSTSANPSDKSYFNNLGVEMVTKPCSIRGITETIEGVLCHCRRDRDEAPAI